VTYDGIKTMNIEELFQKYKCAIIPETGRPPRMLNIRYQDNFIKYMKERHEGKMPDRDDLINEYKAWLFERINKAGVYYSPAWIVENFIRLRLFFKWLAQNRHISKNPLEEFNESRMYENMQNLHEERRLGFMRARMGTLSAGRLSENFLNHIRKYITEGYYFYVDESLGELSDYCAENGKTAVEFKKEDLNGLIKKWASKESRPSVKITVHGILRNCNCIRLFFRWLYNQGYIRENRLKEYSEGDLLELIKKIKAESLEEIPLRKRQYSLKEVLKAYKKYLKGNYESYANFRKMYAYLLQFIRFALLKGKGIYKAEESLGEEYKIYLREYEYSEGHGYTAGIQAERIGFIKRFYDWFVYCGYGKNHPFRDFKVKQYALALETTCRRAGKKDLAAGKAEKIPEQFKNIYDRILVNEKVAGLNEFTIKRHEKGYRLFLAYLHEKGLKRITEADEDTLGGYIVYINNLRNTRQDRLTKGTVCEYLTALRKLCRYLAQARIIPRDISVFMELPKRERGLPTAGMNNREILKLMEQVNPDGGHALRNRAILETLYSTGARVNELRHIRIKDIDFAYGYARLNETKGGKNYQRVVPIGKIACAGIKEYLNTERKTYAGNEWLFVNETGGRMSKNGILYMVKMCAIKGGLKKRIVTHSFRVTCATEMLRNKADIKFVQQQLGHTSISSTERYLRLVPGDLKKVHERCHPRERGNNL
jgi:integrase/recombinase XerD